MLSNAIRNNSLVATPWWIPSHPAPADASDGGDGCGRVLPIRRPCWRLCPKHPAGRAFPWPVSCNRRVPGPCGWRPSRGVAVERRLPGNRPAA